MLADAELLYRKILASNPANADALHLLGVSHHQRTLYESAKDLISEAIRFNPSQAAYHCNLGNTLAALGLHSQATCSYIEAIRLKPDYSDAFYNLGVSFAAQGRKEEAIEAYRKAILLNPDHALAHNNLGNALKSINRTDEALVSYQNAISVQPEYAEAHHNRALALQGVGRLDEALTGFNQALRIRPGWQEALYNQGVTFSRLGRFADALFMYNKLIALNPKHANALNNKGNALKELGHFENALISYEEALRVDPRHADAMNNKGNTLKDLGRLTEALHCYDEVIRLHPLNVSAKYNRGVLLKCMGQLDEALSSYSEVLQLAPAHADTHNNIGNILKQKGKLIEAIESYQLSIKSTPGNATVYNNLGMAFQDMRRLDDALQCYDQAIKLRHNYVEALSNRGSILRAMNRLEDAVESYDQALRVNPQHAAILHNRGDALRELRCLDTALESYDQALQLDHTRPITAGVASFVAKSICHWSDLGDRVTSIVGGIKAGRCAIPPFALLPLVDDPNLQRRATEIYVREKVRPTGLLGKIAMRKPKEKIHVAYLSADYFDHATSHLMAELFELHDRSRFEVTGISFGPDKNDTMQRRVFSAFDRLIDVRNKSDLEVAELCRGLEIDVAIDLKGYTRDSRPEIFAERCAPLQVNWLGYPGTMGAPFIDYVVADHTLISDNELDNYTEQVIRLPDSYQVNDRKRPLPERLVDRNDCGLPETGFVFCCFNNNYKIDPATFESWMRILSLVPEGVLWLLEDNALAAQNLRAEAAARGIDPDRLVFAKRVSAREHMARHQLADLFLDTWPCNAHTTASDALWCGLPVLTLYGRSFAARVAASLLRAVHLAELIVNSAPEYEALAVKLAQNQSTLASIRQRLIADRTKHPLFDCERFTRHLETAYSMITEKYWRGEEPSPITLTRSSS